MFYGDNGLKKSRLLFSSETTPCPQACYAAEALPFTCAMWHSGPDGRNDCDCLFELDVREPSNFREGHPLTGWVVIP